MRSPVLLRRREVWLPTALGWLALLLVGLAVLAAIGANLHGFLALDAPIGARTLVIEGWLPKSELDQAIAEVRRGSYERVLTTGGPIQDEFDRTDDSASYAERASRYLVASGVAAGEVIALPSPASDRDRSFRNALAVREWLTRLGVALEAVDVFSSGVHARRSRALHRLALGPGVRVGVFSARVRGYPAESWWQTSAGTKEVLAEAIAWLWTALFFHPDLEIRARSWSGP